MRVIKIPQCSNFSWSIVFRIFHQKTDSQNLCSFFTERKTPPTFTKKLSEAVEETEGNELKLEGRVSGSQPLTVAWYKNNQEVHSSARCEISFKNNALLLHIKAVEQSDAGLYTCKVSNEAGSVLSTSSVVIRGWLKSCFFFAFCFSLFYLAANI